MMQPVERISFLVVFYKTTIKAFSEDAGLERPQVLYDIQKGKTKSITEKLANKIVSVFSEINKEWLLSGYGEPFKSPYDRICALLRREGMTYQDLEKGGSTLGFLFTKGRVFEHAMDNPADIQILNNWIQTFLDRFGYYSKDWILTGEGSIFSDGRLFFTPGSTPQNESAVEYQDIPLYDYSGNVGLSAFLNDQTTRPVDFLRIPNHPPVDGAIYVRGEAMSPLIKSGDMVMYKKKDLSLDGFLWGEIYLLSFISGGDTYTAVKYIQQSSSPDKVRLVSYNPSFPAIDIPFSSITALALIKASLTFHTME